MNQCFFIIISSCLFSLVIETLKEVDPSRKCFRLVGGVLVERTVKEVLPALENNKEQVLKLTSYIKLKSFQSILSQTSFKLNNTGRTSTI